VEIDSAFKAEFGYTLTELNTLMVDCLALGMEQESPVKKLHVAEMIARLSESTAQPSTRITQILDALSLQSRSDFLRPPAPFKQEDVYPWRFGRLLSYIRRPIIRTMEHGKPIFMWGNSHLNDSRNYIINMCLSGRFHAQAKSQEMRSLMATFNSEKGKEFTLQVQEIFSVYENLVVDSNVRKIGGTRISESGNDLGDIDILVINPRRHRILVVECKDLSIARNPYEMANELKRLFIKDNGLATVVRHQRRANWVSNNLTMVLDHYDVDPKGKWRTEPILVVSEEMLTPHLYQPSMPVISFRTLEQQYSQEWI
jgi:hypothetical protein